jgi:hypothetical protein
MKGLHGFGVESWAYLKDILDRLPKETNHRHHRLGGPLE